MQGINLIYITCLLILLITYLGVVISRNHKNEESKKFILLVFTTIIYIAISLAGVVAEQNKAGDGICFFINLINYFAVDFVFLAFLDYISLRFKEKETKLSKIVRLSIVVATVIRVALILFLGFSGNLFEIINSVYTETEYSFIPYYFSAIVLVMFLVLIFINKKSFSKRQFIVILLYEIIPIPMTLVEAISQIYCFTAIGLTMSILLIYILLQEATINDSKIREEILEEISYTDQLTKMKNRHAYYETIKSLDKNSNIGIVYCDINGLKYANDHFGHFAGDELIKKFSSIAISSFGEECAFRIAGDEFVMIVADSFDEFESKVDSFKQIIKVSKNIAAVGSSYGSANCFNTLVLEAESEMYKDKETFKRKR